MRGMQEEGRRAEMIEKAKRRDEDRNANIKQKTSDGRTGEDERDKTHRSER